jgi:hypothetical protein
MPTYDQQCRRSKITNAASRKKNPGYQRRHKAIRNQPDTLRVPLRERPSLWISPELDDQGSRRNGLWLAP